MAVASSLNLVASDHDALPNGVPAEIHRNCQNPRRSETRRNGALNKWRKTGLFVKVLILL